MNDESSIHSSETEFEIAEMNSESEWEPTDSDLAATDNDSDFDDSDRPITETRNQYFEIRPIRKDKSKSLLWSHYGSLMRNGRVITKCAKRDFCKLCLENKSLKR